MSELTRSNHPDIQHRIGCKKESFEESEDNASEDKDAEFHRKKWFHDL